MSIRSARPVVLLAALSLGVASPWLIFSADEPRDPATGRPWEVAPGLPLLLPGADARFGTPDDTADPSVIGDVDLVVRTGAARPGFFASPPRLAVPGTAEPFGQGVAIPFHVLGWSRFPIALGGGNFGVDLRAMPVIVAAFADLDGDGWVGVTQLDGEAGDAALEAAELLPVGRRLAIAPGARATGEIVVTAGGPSGAPLVVMLGAAAYIGPFRADFFEGAVPDGPAVFTALPFLPRTDPARVLQGRVAPASADALLGAEIDKAFLPDPASALYGEGFALATDGSEFSVDGAVVSSGAFAGFALAGAPDPASYLASEFRPLRAGLDASGRRQALEVLQLLLLADDGAQTSAALRLVPVDRLGNVADLDAPRVVALETAGALRIVAPDADGDTARESVVVADARGIELVVDDSGGAFDDRDAASLVIASAPSLARLDAVLPDPDVDDSGAVDLDDVAIVEAARGARLGDLDYDPRLDANRDGSIDELDAAEVASRVGAVVPVP